MEPGFTPVRTRKRFFQYDPGSVRMDAIACTACGAVSLYVDRDKLIDLAGDPGETEPPGT